MTSVGAPSVLGVAGLMHDFWAASYVGGICRWTTLRYTPPTHPAAVNVVHIEAIRTYRTKGSFKFNYSPG